jgi:hypothetical protein
MTICRLSSRKIKGKYFLYANLLIERNQNDMLNEDYMGRFIVGPLAL